jgi:DNA (cytosine-5)-methyltransferase 1
MLTSPSVGSLFTGIGGIDLGLERAGFRVAWMCERDEYCQRVLEKHWPGVPIYDDATNLPDDVERVDVITAGFPCQPVSYAGRRKAQDDERWLWPYVQDCISVLRPRGVLLENVPGLLTAGFDDVIGGLAACGYDAEWDCIPAAAVGAPHLRDRIFVIATPCDAATESENWRWDDPMADANDTGNRTSVSGTDGDGAPRDEGWHQQSLNQPGRHGATVANTASMSGHECDHPTRQLMEPRQDEICQSGNGGWAGLVANTERSRPREQGESQRPVNPAAGPAGQVHRPVHDRAWATEPDVGRVANGVPNRVDRLRALGNAVVPQVAEYVGHQLARMMGVRDA